MDDDLLEQRRTTVAAMHGQGSSCGHDLGGMGRGKGGCGAPIDGLGAAGHEMGRGKGRRWKMKRMSLFKDNNFAVTTPNWMFSDSIL